MDANQGITGIGLFLEKFEFALGIGRCLECVFKKFYGGFFDSLAAFIVDLTRNGKSLCRCSKSKSHCCTL